MKIAQANVQLATQRRYSEQNSQQNSLQVWVGSGRPVFTQKSSVTTRGADRLSLGNVLPAPPVMQAPGKAVSTTANNEDDVKNDPHMFIVKRMIESITGETMHLSAVNVSGSNTQTAPVTASPQLPNPGFGLEFDSHTVHTESEQTAVAAQGSVQTAEGKTVDFALNLDMQREYVQQSNNTVRLGSAKKVDPLVLSLDGSAVQLTDTKVSFDLNSDGTNENLSFVMPSSGFLALDKNGDGQINNGSELFGTQTGNGFAELAAYDTDHNQWIDESDAVFQKLQIWTKNAQGQDQLSTLVDNHIGAIYLGSVGSAFSIKDQQNQLLGQVRSTGVYLQENGRAKTIQQIDLAV